MNRFWKNIHLTDEDNIAKYQPLALLLDRALYSRKSLNTSYVSGEIIKNLY